MDLTVDFIGGLKVQARFQEFTVVTDQAKANGGEGSAPEPYALFLTSLATCAGFFILRFCQTRQIAAENIRLTMRNDWNREKGCPAVVVCADFAGHTMLKQHRMVFDAIGQPIRDNTIHALSLKTYTPQAWDEAGQPKPA